MMDEIKLEEFLGKLVSVTLTKPENFLFVKETLTRIGIASKTEKKLFQSCHILKKRNKFYIMHFKELFLLDGKPSNFTDEDLARRNMIVHLLSEWGLVRVDDPNKIENPMGSMSQVKIIPFKEKEEWQLESKYQIGNKRKNY